MRALVFGTDAQPFTPPDGANRLVRNLASTPCALLDVPDARPLRPDWYVVRPLLTGICGSDAKQVLLDFGGDSDSAMSGLCSFPQVLGHEVVGVVHAAGPEAAGFEVGERVVLNPWLSCAPRGISPMCPACRAGDLSLCWSFTTGDISAGLHTGVSSDASGGFAELMPAHPTMLFAVPDGIDDEHAILADPFAVSLHSVTRHPPPPGGRALVWGAGALGSAAVAILRALFPDVEVGVVARFDAQADLARRLGAHEVFRTGEREPLLEELAAWSGGVLQPTMEGLGGLPMCHPGGIDVAYDTIAKPETLELEVRVLRARGTLVKSGVHAPGRWEWSPLYFKEISLVGSNAFGIEEVEGEHRHGIEHYLRLASSGRVDLTGLLTHTFGLSDWQAAFAALADQERTGAIKVAIDPAR
ncbi:zinc-dependent alcohol dehydrogenase [Dermatobacter hominis]|uniref:zinc-dependent alcohol dehydrogenase n=1 Tax=Dermatobacter hominis TaxID=2884263 RepID=UPI001D103A92|nr:alcohol dehydrogenase catalytic domain-containing protein [Dermatobacter hominis]UDY35068.1 alcohol dehydrogenase catalytic domain-containing protein [Dermatobacter hominis]